MNMFVYAGMRLNMYINKEKRKHIQTHTNKLTYIHANILTCIYIYIYIYILLVKST